MSTGFARALAAALLLGAACCLGGCCSLGLRSCTTTDVIGVSAAPNLNSCDGTSHSVVLRIYSLTATDAFARGDFDQIWAEEGRGLGDQKAAVHELVVVPGQPVQEIRLERPKGTVALGVVANFCAHESGCWYTIVEPGEGAARLRIDLENVCLRAGRP